MSRRSACVAMRHSTKTDIMPAAHRSLYWFMWAVPGRRSCCSFRYSFTQTYYSAKTYCMDRRDAIIDSFSYISAHQSVLANVMWSLCLQIVCTYPVYKRWWTDNRQRVTRVRRSMRRVTEAWKGNDNWITTVHEWIIVILAMALDIMITLCQ